MVFTELTRRQALQAGAFGSLPARRIDQLVAPSSSGLPPPPAGNLVQARRVIVTGPGEGIYSYSPSIGSGNLVASEGLVSGGLDPIGLNTVLPGDTVYEFVGGAVGFLALNVWSGFIRWMTAPTANGAYTLVAEIQAQPGSGVMTISGLSPINNFQIQNMSVTIPSALADATSAGWSGGFTIGKGNTPNVTNNSNGFPNMFGATITTPSGDLSTTGGWRVTEWGHGVWGSTLQALSMSLIISGGTGPSLTVPTGSQSISGAFKYLLEGMIMPQSLGVAGTFTAWLRLTLDTGATPLFTESSGLAINTTGAVGWLQQSHWASATGTPTITSDGFTFERVSL